MSQSKRRALTVEEKARIIKRIENGEKNGKIARECGISHSTISTFWKNREKILALYKNNSLKVKRFRAPKHNIIDKILLKWCKHQRANNARINGPLLQRKAKEIARQMRVKNFQCSASWVQRFRARHNIVSRAVFEPPNVSEPNNPPLNPSEWLSHTWPTLCKGYSAQEIFNTAETVLYYNIIPGEILKFRGKLGTNELQSKTKITLLVTANMTGSAKEKLLVIGDAESKCLNSFQSVIYKNNTRSCMTVQIFETWLHNWDIQLKLRGEKVLLINSSSIQSEVPNLNCIKLVTLTNITSISPMDQVIKSFKTQYRKFQLLQMFHNTEHKETESLSLLDALLSITEAWERVTPNTIANAFQEAELINLPLLKPDKDEDDLLIARLASGIDKHHNTALAQLATQSLDISVSETDIDYFISIDNSVNAVCATTEDSAGGDDCNVDEEIKLQQFPALLPTLSEAISAVKIVQKFIAFNKDFYTDINHVVLKELKCKMQNAFELKSSKQIKSEFQTN